MHEGEAGAGEGERGTAAPDAARDPVAALETRLGVALADRDVALAALTHRSYVNEHREDGLQDNERLEFLGDAVIDLAVSHRLMERFPSAREGDLSKMRAAVVDEQGLADMARALDLGSLLRLGRGEELTGGRAKASLLADAMEAVIAAVYRAQGLPAVLAVIDRFLGEAFARAIAGTLDRDFKTQLQELAQSRLRVTPRYRVVAEHGPDHSKLFEVEVDLRGEVLGRGRGRSKKDSEQAAARLALEVLGRRLAAEAAPGEGGAPAPGAALAAEAPPEAAQGEPAEAAPPVERAEATGPEPAGATPPGPPGGAAGPAPAAPSRPEPEATAGPEPAPPAAPAPHRRPPPRKRPAPRRAAPASKVGRAPKKSPPRAAKGGSSRAARKGSRAGR